jgi:flavin reductase (DIM6/NTAB) family NADH-FMN oxidoreductase RutF
MALHAFNAGCNIVAMRKGGHDYGMCCAWAQMLDYDRIGMLIGSQSVTGRMLDKGDIVGVSALCEGQEAIASRFGDGHSDSVDKFAGIGLSRSGDAILINGARVRMTCEVLDVMRMEGIEADRYVVMHVRAFAQSEEKAFLSAYFE